MNKPESRDMHLQETHPQLKEKFLAFRKKLLHEANHIFYFKSPRDLELAVRLNMPLMVEQYMGQGWVPARQAHHLEDEINRLKSKILQLEQQLSESSIQANEVAPQDVLLLNIKFRLFKMATLKSLSCQRQMTWSQLLSILAKHFESSHARRELWDLPQ